MIYLYQYGEKNNAAAIKTPTNLRIFKNPISNRTSNTIFKILNPIIARIIPPAMFNILPPFTFFKSLESLFHRGFLGSGEMKRLRRCCKPSSMLLRWSRYFPSLALTCHCDSKLSEPLDRFGSYVPGIAEPKRRPFLSNLMVNQTIQKLLHFLLMGETSEVLKDNLAHSQNFPLLKDQIVGWNKNSPESCDGKSVEELPDSELESAVLGKVILCLANNILLAIALRLPKYSLEGFQ